VAATLAYNSNFSLALAAVMVVLGGYRLLAPAGWRRIGGTARG
jgi:uncharacterized protein YjeT (DUF2065 family)